MENEKKPEMPADDSWFDELLARPEVGEELSADEQAVNAAGLTDPADMELEKIILETQNMEIPSVDEPEMVLAFDMEEISGELPPETTADVPAEVLASIAEDVPEDALASVVEDLPEDALASVPEDVPEDALASVPEDAPEDALASIVDDIPVVPLESIIDDIPDEAPADTDLGSVEDILAEIVQEFPAKVTDETIVSLPSTPVEESMDATMVHTIDPSNSTLWPLVETEEAPAEETPRELPETPFLDDEYRNTFGESGEALEEVFADMYVMEEKPSSKEPEPTPTRRKPERKGRPKMKKGYGLLGIPHIISTVIWLAIILAIGVSLGRMAWVITTDVLAFGRESRECVVTITENDNIDTIANKLKNAGLIKYPELFKIYANLTDAGEEITPGTFTLNTKYDYMALVNYMSDRSSIREEVEVLIPEGYTCAQIFALLEEKGVCKVADLEEYAANGELGEYWFLEGVERGAANSLEGYLFPDTYKFYTNDKPGRVLSKMLDNFDYRFTDIMKEKLDALNTRMGKVMASNGYDKNYIEEHKFTMRDIVIIASMIEKETANDSESYDVASVIYNRLTNAKEYPYLNIDATLIYALDGNIDPETGKTKPLTSADLKMEHPYNTYTEKGMIPGPISNPGRNSLNAALDPNETKYYFYVFNPNTGVHLFAKNAKDHQKNVDYVRSLEEN